MSNSIPAQGSGGGTCKRAVLQTPVGLLHPARPLYSPLPTD
jgi:hypothetical protein